VLTHPVWRECFLLAWESFRVGSVAVGAVLVDPDGGIVARGRNRFNEPTGPPGEVAGSFVAHAELTALATVPPGDYAGHVLYSTLEPCLMCTGVLRHSHVGTVRYAADDPMWRGIERLPELNANVARRWARRDGPVDGPLRTLGAVLPLISAVERNVGSVIRCHEETMPDVLRLARRWAGTCLRAMSLDEAVAELL
jgi:tRNA(adenine34) deaminase